MGELSDTYRKGKAYHDHSLLQLLHAKKHITCQNGSKQNNKTYTCQKMQNQNKKTYHMPKDAKSK